MPVSVVIVSMAVVVAVRVAMPMIVFMGISVVLILTVVIAIIVPVFGAIAAAVELLFPAAMAVPIGMHSPGWQSAAVAVVWVETAVVVSAETYRACEPRSGANEYAALKPLGTVIAKGRAIVRRVVEVSIRAYRRRANIYGNVHLRVCSTGRRGKKKYAE